VVQGNINLKMKATSTELREGKGATCVRVVGDGGEWSRRRLRSLTSKTRVEAERSQPIAAAGAEALNESFGAELAQVVAELAEAVVGVTEPVAGEDAACNSCVVHSANEGHQD